MPETKQYGGITRAELDRLRSDLAKEDVTVPQGDDVMIQGPYGIEIQGTYNAERETLKMTIIKKSFFIPESTVWDVVDTAVTPYVGS